MMHLIYCNLDSSRQEFAMPCTKQLTHPTWGGATTHPTSLLMIPGNSHVGSVRGHTPKLASLLGATQSVPVATSKRWQCQVGFPLKRYVQQLSFYFVGCNACLDCYVTVRTVPWHLASQPEVCFKLLGRISTNGHKCAYVRSLIPLFEEALSCAAFNLAMFLNVLTRLVASQTEWNHHRPEKPACSMLFLVIAMLNGGCTTATVCCNPHAYNKQWLSRRATNQFLEEWVVPALAVSNA